MNKSTTSYMLLEVTPELTTLAETSETVSSSACGIKVAVTMPPPPPAACNGPKRIGGWGRLKARAASEDHDPPATVVTSSSSSLSPSPVVPASGCETGLLRDSPVRIVPEICLRTDEDDDIGESRVADNSPVAAKAPLSVRMVVPVSEAAGPAARVPESSFAVAAATAAATAGPKNSSQQGLVDPSEMLASLQQFKVSTL